MKNKKIFIILIILTVFLLPIITFATIKVYNVDTSGRTIIYSAEDMKNLENGTEISLAIPADTTNNEQLSDEQIKEEKEKILEEIQNNDNTQIDSISEDEIMNLQDELENTELENKVEEFKQIFCKYYGEEYSNELFSNIQEETYEISADEVPESSIIMLEKAIQLVEDGNITNDEKEVIKYIFDAMDTSYIEDTSILDSFESLGVELDS